MSAAKSGYPPPGLFCVSSICGVAEIVQLDVSILPQTHGEVGISAACGLGRGGCVEIGFSLRCCFVFSIEKGSWVHEAEVFTPRPGRSLLMADCGRHVLSAGATVAPVLKPEPRRCSACRCYRRLLGLAALLVLLATAARARIISSCLHAVTLSKGSSTRKPGAICPPRRTCAFTGGGTPYRARPCWHGSTIRTTAFTFPCIPCAYRSWCASHVVWRIILVLNGDETFPVSDIAWCNCANCCFSVFGPMLKPQIHNVLTVIRIYHLHSLGV